MSYLVFRFGMLCSNRPRRRRILCRERNSLHRAYEDGSDRDRYRSPSSLSQGFVMVDIPSRPASSACSSASDMARHSSRVGF